MLLFILVIAFIITMWAIFVSISRPETEAERQHRETLEYLNQNQRALARAREYEREMGKQRAIQSSVVEESERQITRQKISEFIPTQSVENAGFYDYSQNAYKAGINHDKPSLQELLAQGRKNHQLDSNTNYQPTFDDYSKSSSHAMNDFAYHVATDYYVTWRDEYEFNVVGTSHYQHILEKFADPRTEYSQEKEIMAFIQHEPTNPHDENACAVYIQYECVGYLPREDASKFISTLKRLNIPTDSTVAVKAMIVGGWLRANGDMGNFGLYLDLPESIGRISKSISHISFEDSYRKLKTRKSKTS